MPYSPVWPGLARGRLPLTSMWPGLAHGHVFVKFLRPGLAHGHAFVMFLWPGLARGHVKTLSTSTSAQTARPLCDTAESYVPHGGQSPRALPKMPR